VVATQVEFEKGGLEAIRRILLVAQNAETKRGQAGVNLGSTWGQPAPPDRGDRQAETIRHHRLAFETVPQQRGNLA